MGDAISLEKLFQEKSDSGCDSEDFSSTDNANLGALAKPIIKSDSRADNDSDSSSIESTDDESTAKPKAKSGAITNRKKTPFKKNKPASSSDDSSSEDEPVPKLKKVKAVGSIKKPDSSDSSR